MEIDERTLIDLAFTCRLLVEMVLMNDEVIG